MSEVNRLVYSVEVTEDKIHIIHLKDVFDPSTVEEFEHVLEYLFSNNHYKIVVDLSRVEFVSSAGWGTFSGELNKCRDNGGDIVLVGMQPEVFDVFMLLELDTFIEAFETIESALRQARSRASSVMRHANKIVEQQKQNKDLKNQNGRNKPVEKKSPKPRDNGKREKTVEEHLDEIEQDTHGLQNLEISEDETLSLDLPLEDLQDKSGTPPAEKNQPPGRPKSASHSQQEQKRLKSQPNEEAESGTEQNQQAPAPARPKRVTPEFASRPNAHQPERVQSHVLSSLAEARDEAIQKTEKKKHFFDADFYFGKPLATFEEDRDETAPDPEPNPEPRRQPVERPVRENVPDFSQPVPPIPNAQLDPLLEKIISVVIANPSYGPSSIRQMLINMNLVQQDVTRSTIFKKLNEINLSTRTRREEFARAHRL